MIHPDLAGVKKAEIRAVISKKFKATEDRIAVFGVRAKFGGGRSSGFVTVYDDMDARKKYDNKQNMGRVSESTSHFERQSSFLGAREQPRDA
jgi:small subunit ribosomal protein S24e